MDDSERAGYPEAAEEAADEGVAEEEAEGAPEAEAESPGEEVREFLQQVLDRMDLEAEARLVSSEGNQIALEVVGEDVALLIGKHGQTLDALQLLVAAGMARKLPGHPRILLDAEGYRERRADSLRRMALSLARQALDSGQEAVMEGLNAAERRIIHTALADEPGVGTYSEGEEPNRRVVITPTD